MKNYLVNNTVKVRMRYQDELSAFGKEIFNCPHFHGTCQGELADVSNGLYKHGPEISFVGERYGQPGTMRILFTRLNPTWNQDIGWFGTRESVTEYQLQHPDAGTENIFQRYLRGWNHGDKVFRGIWDAGTITGHPNKSSLPGEKKRKSPRYGIQLIMEEMIRAGVFPVTDDSPLQFCAINNVVKCAGSGKNWNPSNSMSRNCNYYMKELDLLMPHIVVAFGKDTDSYIRARLQNRFSKVGNKMLLALPDGSKCRYFPFLHPLGQGKSTWLGSDVVNLRPAPNIARELGPKEKERFKAGPQGSSTSTLFNYTLHLVSETKRLKGKMSIN